MRRFILSSSYEQRVEALNNIRNYQVEDFEAIFRLSGERPTIVRLLDPPLHEFYPPDEDVENVARQLNIPKEVLNKRIVDLHEVNQC